MILLCDGKRQSEAGASFMHLYGIVSGGDVVEVVLFVHTNAATNTNTELNLAAGVNDFVSGRKDLDQAGITLIVRFVPDEAGISLTFPLSKYFVLLNAARAFADFLASRGTCTPQVEYNVVTSVPLTVPSPAVPEDYSGVKGDGLANTTSSALQRRSEFVENTPKNEK